MRKGIEPTGYRQHNDYVLTGSLKEHGIVLLSDFTFLVQANKFLLPSFRFPDHTWPQLTFFEVEGEGKRDRK